MVYEFAEFELDEGSGELRRSGSAVPLEPKPFAVLRYLIRHRDRIVPKGEMLGRIWPDVVVGEGSLSSSIRSVRRALGDTGSEQLFVRTLRGRGFRFVAPVRERSVEAAHSDPGEITEAGRFVGRTDVLAALEQALAEASRGRGRLVLLTGEPGIGKTRTAEELARLATAAAGVPPLVLTGWCPSQSGAQPYWPWLRILRGLVDAVDDETLQAALRTSASDLTRLVPELATRVPDLHHDEGEADTSRFRLFDAIAAFLRRAAAGRTLLLLLDDLQWADRSSLRLLEFLSREMVQTRILLVSTLRESELDDDDPVWETLETLARVRGFERIELGGLDRDEVASLVRILSTAWISDERIDEIAERSGGNPFFVRELALAYSELELHDVAPGEARLPPLVRGVLRGRLQRLPPSGTEVLEAASVQGTRFETTVVAEASRRSCEEVEEVLDRAGREGLIVRDPLHLDWRFSHALNHDAVRAAVAKVRAQQLHYRIAHAIESQHRDELDDHASALAHHLGEALPLADREDAIRWSSRAGDVAEHRLAFEEAVTHHTRASQLYEDGGQSEPGRAGRLAYALARSLQAAGQESRAFEEFSRAAELAGSSGDAALLSDAALGAVRASWYARANATTECVPLLEKALVALPANDSRRRALVTARLSETPYWTDEERERFAREALSLAERVGDPRSTATALFACYLLCFRPGAAARRLELVTRLVRVSEAARIGDWACEAHRLRYAELLVQGRIRESEAELRALGEWAERVRRPALLAAPGVDRAARAVWEGRFDDAETLASEAMSLLGSWPSGQIGPNVATQKLILRAFQGRLAEVEPLLEHAAEGSKDAGAWTCARMWMRFRLDRTNAARRDLEILLPGPVELPLDQFRIPSLAMLAEVAAGLGDRGRCERLLPELEPEAGLEVVVVPNLVLGCASRPLGLLAQTLGRYTEAERHFEVALEADRLLGARPWVAETQVDLAALLKARGHREDERCAAELLEQASCAARELEMPTLLERITDLRL